MNEIFRGGGGYKSGNFQWKIPLIYYLFFTPSFPHRISNKKSCSLRNIFVYSNTFSSVFANVYDSSLIYIRKKISDKAFARWKILQVWSTWWGEFFSPLFIYRYGYCGKLSSLDFVALCWILIVVTLSL